MPSAPTAGAYASATNLRQAQGRRDQSDRTSQRHDKVVVVAAPDQPGIQTQSVGVVDVSPLGTSIAVPNISIHVRSVWNCMSQRRTEHGYTRRSSCPRLRALLEDYLALSNTR
jgi:hypothetical protein